MAQLSQLEAPRKAPEPDPPPLTPEQLREAEYNYALAYMITIAKQRDAIGRPPIPEASWETCCQFLSWYCIDLIERPRYGHMIFDWVRDYAFIRFVPRNPVNPSITISFRHPVPRMCIMWPSELKMHEQFLKLSEDNKDDPYEIYPVLDRYIL